MKIHLKPVKNFDEVIALFGNSEKFKERIEEYRSLLDELNKKLEGADNLDELEAGRANLAALESNATAQYRLAREAHDKAKFDAQYMIEGAQARVKDVNDSAELREGYVARAETELAARETNLEEARGDVEDTRLQTEALAKKIRAELSVELEAAKLLRTELDEKLIKVNKLLGE